MLRNGNISGSELRDKIELYSELTGQDGWNVPITKVADFISGFEIGKEKFRKRGRWITWKEAGNEIASETKFECSVCHDSAQTLCNGLDLLSPYCPNCGADMRED